MFSLLFKTRNASGIKVTGTSRDKKHTAQLLGGPGATGSRVTRLKGREGTVRDPSTSEGRARLAGRALSYLPPPPPSRSPPSHALAHTHVEERTQTLECMMRPRVLERLMGKGRFGEGWDCFYITNTLLQTHGPRSWLVRRPWTELTTASVNAVAKQHTHDQ